MAIRPGAWGAPFVPLYGAAVLLRRWAFDRGLLPVMPPPVLTVSVGGLEAGGTGKTPVAGCLLAAFRDAGKKPGLLTRGYGRTSQGLVMRHPGEPALAHVIGDEPAMLVASGLDVPVAASAKRVLGARALVDAGCDVLVLDDGFQHRWLGRQVDIVVMCGEAPFGSGHLLPWGTLREPPGSLARARVLWLHFRGAADPEVAPAVRRYAPRAAVVVSEQQATVACDEHGRAVSLAGVRVVAAAGVARPEGVRNTIAALGGEVVELRPYADHHRYSAADAHHLARIVERCGARALVVTAKDAVKLRTLWQGPPLLTVGARVCLVSGHDDLAHVLGVPRSTLH